MRTRLQPRRTSCVALFLVAATCALAGASDAQPKAEASGLVRVRVLRVETSRLVTILGGEATEADTVFAVPIERFLALANRPDSGVQLEESEFRLRGQRLRLDGVGSGGGYVLVDLANTSMQWMHPKERAYVEWRKPNDPARRPTPLSQLEPLGRELTIHGFRTRGYRMQASGGTAWLWIASEPAALAPVMKRIADLQLAVKSEPETLDQWAIGRAMQEGVPIRVQALSPKEYVIRELVSFTPKTWDAAEFQVPAGWKAIPVERAGAASPAGSCQNCE
ncbi:MAG: hypothetical protein KatS3mg077_2356 [Candidatus Binatia bacterium]|nr:MAG: hypothetical protein KatS3mg077_2356 [Candidatus Binatia bacterium]